MQAAFGKCCETTSEPSIPDDSPLRTYSDLFGVPGFDIGFRYNPWRSPGAAPVFSPCGVAGGNEPGSKIVGYPPGFRGEDLPSNPGMVSWEAGSTQEVSWSLFANHGGGYSYRICPKSENLTEACFQHRPLQLVGDSSWIQFSDDRKNRSIITAMRTTNGTFPPGSQWTRNPIPACGGYPGGAAGVVHEGACKKSQFPPVLSHVIAPDARFAPLPGLYGFGPGSAPIIGHGDHVKFWQERFNFNIVDQVKVPNLPEGDYVVGFRYDCEQTPQVWNNCVRCPDSKHRS